MRARILEDFLKKRRESVQWQGEDPFSESDALLRVMFDQSSLLMGVLKPDGTVLRINSTAFRLIREREAEVVGRAFWDTPWWSHSPEQRELLKDAVAAAAKGLSIRFEATITTSSGALMYIDFSLKPVPDEEGRVVYLFPEGRDLTERKLAEESISKSYALLRAMFDQSSLLMGLLLPDGTVHKVNATALSFIKGREEEVLGTLFWETPWWSHLPEQQQRLRDAVARAAGGEFVRFEAEIWTSQGTPMFIDFSLKPVVDDRGKVVLLLPEGRDITEQKRAAGARLEHARMTRELEIAKEIQQSFLPVCPSSLPGLLMTCSCQPAAHVGGDYYDFFPLEDGVVDAVIADVTGHSVGSSLLMTMARSVLNAKVGRARSPGALLAAVNDLLYHDLSRAELQISMFYVRLDTGKKTLTWANAGHIRPLLYRAGTGACQELDAEGLLMGIRTEVRFEEEVVAVERGDILMLYTDGVTEAQNRAGEMFGCDRLGRVISAHRELHPQEIMGAVFRELGSFTRADDVAMIIFKVV